MSHEVVWLGSIPAISGVSVSRSCAWHCRQHGDGIVAERCHRFKCDVACALDGRFIGLFHEDGANEAGDRGFVREDADHLVPALDLAIEPLDGIRAVQLGAMPGGGHVGQHIGFGIVHQGC